MSILRFSKIGNITAVEIAFLSLDAGSVDYERLSQTKGKYLILGKVKVKMKRGRKFLALLFSLILVLSLVSMAYAEETGNELQTGGVSPAADETEPGTTGGNGGEGGGTLPAADGDIPTTTGDNEGEGNGTLPAADGDVPGTTEGEDENELPAGSVSLTVDGGEPSTYNTITEAVKALKEVKSYEAAAISFSGEYTENVDASRLSNVSFDGNGTATLKGTLRVDGSNITISGIHFQSVLDIAVGYYDNDTAINMCGGANIQVKNNSFSGYNYVSNYQTTATVTAVLFDHNSVSDCVFFLHTSDGNVNGLSVTNNTITGTNLVCASLMGATTVSELSGNTFSYAYFGLQNCDSLSAFLNSNTYDHGYLVDDAVYYSDGLTPHDGSSTLMTVLPEGAYAAVWTSSNDTQQSAIETPQAKTSNTITFTGPGAAVGYSYNSITVDYLYYGRLIIEKTFSGDVVAADDLTFTIHGPNSYEQTVKYSNFTDGKYTLAVEPGEYVIEESNQAIDQYTCTTTVNGVEAASCTVTVNAGETQTAAFVNTYTPVPPETPAPTQTPSPEKTVDAVKTGDESHSVFWLFLMLAAFICITVTAVSGKLLYSGASQKKK